MMFTRLLGVGREGGGKRYFREYLDFQIRIFICSCFTQELQRTQLWYLHSSRQFVSAHYSISACSARLFFQSQLFKAKNWYLKLSITEPMIDFCLSKSHDMTRTLRFLSNTPNYFSKKSWTMMVEIGFAKKKTDKALIV